jgi:dolichyl-phosphate-mannose--protein O-mannosyl transferase
VVSLSPGPRVPRDRGGPAPPSHRGAVVGGVAVLYLLWLAVTAERSFTFLFYLLPAMPFMCLALATVLTAWVQSLGGRAIVALFCALAIASFAFFYPVLTATPLSKQAAEAR